MRLNKADELKMKELAKKNGLTFDQVHEIISSQNEFINKTIKEINLKDNLTREEFDKMKTNFNIPSLCKLFASYYLYTRINNNKKKNK